MISDEELAELPEDPELAFVEFERILRARTEEEERQELRLNTEEGLAYSANPYRRQYINKVLAAVRVYGISELESWRVPSVHDDIVATYINFTSDVDHFTTQVRLRNSSRNRQNSVGLDGNTKTKIHHYVHQIRAAIEESDLPEPKRDALYNKLSAFVREVDKSRTNLQSGMAIYIAVCDGIGQGFQKLEPARKWIDSIAALLGRAKEVEDSLRPALPAPAERRRLEPPRQPPELPASSPDDLEEEIPF